MKHLKVSILTLVLAFIFVLNPVEVQAKMFGTETIETTREIGAGQCHTVKVKKFKLFWITVSKSVEHSINTC
ncbi:MAG: hypothetical protein ACON30_08440 [Flavobacteriaceae bacterium]